jgi:hypothetical protein
MEEFSDSIFIISGGIEFIRNYLKFKFSELRLENFTISSLTNLAPISPMLFPLFAKECKKNRKIQLHLYSSSVDAFNPFLITSDPE